MGRSWKICTAFGIGVYIHWSFILLPMWVFAMTNHQAGPESAVYWVGVMLALFACVVLHEFGHALTARYFGVQTRDITLYPIGGVARLERMTEQPWEEFWIALGGPAVNFVLAPIFIVLGLLLTSRGQNVMPMHFTGIGPMLVTLGILNVMPLALFNLLPAFPMDGGRVLRALLAVFLGALTATEIAASIGMAMSGLFILGGLFLSVSGGNGVMFMLLGVFVMLMGQRELAAVRHRERYRGQEVLQVLPADSDVMDVRALPARPNFSGFTWDGYHNMWVEWRDGHPIHRIELQSD